jgi:hypothetical protein
VQRERKRVVDGQRVGERLGLRVRDGRRALCLVAALALCASLALAAVTSLGHKGPGDLVNIEVDVMAKYVERLLKEAQ